MKSNLELLRLMDLPVFSDESELATIIHVDPRLIKAITGYSRSFYRAFKLPKSTGGFRAILEPNKKLKAIQAWVLRNILDRLSPSPFATAYIAGRNISDNTKPHRNNRYFVCLDLEDFFPSISVRRVTKIFSLLGYSKRAASSLAMICTCRGKLPQGAVTSPSLSNLIGAKLDRRIAGYASRRNIIYTRYSDDITLSSNNRVVLCKTLRRILKIIKSEHFRPNTKKLRIIGPRKSCNITGLIKNNSESRFGIGRKKKRQMRAVMHHNVFARKPDPDYQNESSIVGWLSYLKSVDEISYAQMLSYWTRIRAKAAVA